jgi:hypothetical protein
MGKCRKLKCKTQVSANYVTHFTREFETLLKIIDEGFRPNVNEESQIYTEDLSDMYAFKLFCAELTGVKETDETLISKIPMVCFSDIPLRQTTELQRKFGNYCIALTKSWANTKRISPVIYVDRDSSLHGILRAIFKLKQWSIDIPANDERTIINQQIELLLEYVKPCGKATKGDYTFYNEREWRYIHPPLQPLDSPEYYVKFNKEDIVFFIVQNTKEKRILLDKLKEKFGSIKGKYVKVQKTRLVK